MSDFAVQQSPVHQVQSQPQPQPSEQIASVPPQQALDGARIDDVASAQQSAGEKFAQFSGKRALSEPPMPGPIERVVGKVVDALPFSGSREVNQLADALAAGSPTLKAQLDKYREEGGRLVDGGKTSAFTDGDPPKIAIPSKTPFGTPVGERMRMQAIAHELGHHAFARMHDRLDPKPTTGNGGHSDATIEQRRENAYVERGTANYLGNEAFSTEWSARVRDEYKQNTGVDVGVMGIADGVAVPPTQELAEAYANGRTSITDETYRDYYTRELREQYQRKYAPGKAGNLE